MSREAFEFVSSLVKSRSGLVLTPDKLYMLETRLASILKRDAIPSLDALAMKLRSPGNEGLLKDVVEALTTNESSFFRDGKPFEHFRRFALQWASRRGPGAPLRVWSAACSTGQEAYSVAIILQEEGIALGRRVEIIGTDLSRDCIRRASDGLFTQFEVQRGLPMQHLMKYFRQEGAQRWQIDRNLRGMCRFEEKNLLNDCLSIGKFDAIFCRNVLIYFDTKTKAKVLDSIADLMLPDAVLYLGGAETVLGLTDRFSAVNGERGVYTLASSPGGIGGTTW